MIVALSSEVRLAESLSSFARGCEATKPTVMSLACQVTDKFYALGHGSLSVVNAVDASGGYSVSSSVNS